MKKQSVIMNESGFYLPYVLIVAIITISLISTTVLIYENEVQLTELFLEQIENETLIQMARAKFKQEQVDNLPETGKVTYTFPNGTVNVNYYEEKEEQYLLTLHVITKNNARFKLQSRIYVPIE